MGEVISVGIPSIFGLTGEKTAFQDEGALLGEAKAVNFVGDGVVATLLAGVLTVQIDGGAVAELVTTLGEVNETDTTHGVAASVVFELGTEFGQALMPLAPKDSPALTGTPTAPTKNSEDATTALATTEFVHSISDPFVDELANKAPLVDGLVPAIYLPSFVDDVLEFADLASFPVVGEAGKIYIAIDTALDYRWTGSVYSVIGQTPDVVGIGANAFTRYDQAQVLSAPQKAQVKANIGLSDSDGLAEGTTNKYFTNNRVLNTILAGLSLVSSAAVTAADSVLDAIGKLQAQVSGKEPTLPANIGSVKFLREDRTFQSIIDVVLTGLSVATNSAVVATDSILVAIGKLQAQASAVNTALFTARGTGNTISTGCEAVNCTSTVVQGTNNVAINCANFTVATAQKEAQFRNIRTNADLNNLLLPSGSMVNATARRVCVESSFHILKPSSNTPVFVMDSDGVKPVFTVGSNSPTYFNVAVHEITVICGLGPLTAVRRVTARQGYGVMVTTLGTDVDTGLVFAITENSGRLDVAITGAGGYASSQLALEVLVRSFYGA